MPDIISTPLVSAVDPRGLPVRSARYYRSAKAIPGIERVERRQFDATGSVIAQYDARSVARGEAVRIASAARGMPHTWSADTGDAWQLRTDADAPLWSRDANGTWHDVSYDEAGRPVARREGHGVSVRCLGRVTYAGADAWQANLAGVPTLVFDHSGRKTVSRIALTGQTQASAHALLADDAEPDWPAVAALEPPAATQASYDALGATLTSTDAAGHMQDIVRGVDGLPTALGVTLPNGKHLSLVTALHYDASGEPLAQYTANGVSRTWSRDPDDGHLLATKIARRATTLQDLNYTYDPAGNMLSIVDVAAPIVFYRNTKISSERRYAYDAFHQLIEAQGREHASAGTGPGLPDVLPIGSGPSALRAYVLAYTYDAAGNHTRMGSRDITVAPLSNRTVPASVTSDPGQVDRLFDATGNTLRQYPGGAVLTWNGRCQLHEATTVMRDRGENDSERYLYDGSGQRVRKRWRREIAGSMRLTDTCYFGPLERRHDDVTGRSANVTTVTFGNDRVRVCVDDTGKESLRYGFADHLGSTSIELDEGGMLASCEEYYPFGGTAWQAANSQQEADWRSVRYSGKERDATGLYYYGFRYYVPWHARWLNPDPAGDIDGLNGYAMVANNPVNHRDADGLMFGKLTKRFDRRRDPPRPESRYTPSPSLENRPLEEKFWVRDPKVEGEVNTKPLRHGKITTKDKRFPNEDAGTIILKGKSKLLSETTGVKYSGRAHYDINRTTGSLEITELMADPEGNGLGNVLLFHAAIISNKERLGRIMILNAARTPGAMKFYDNLGLAGDEEAAEEIRKAFPPEPGPDPTSAAGIEHERQRIGVQLNLDQPGIRSAEVGEVYVKAFKKLEQKGIFYRQG